MPLVHGLNYWNCYYRVPSDPERRASVCVCVGSAAVAESNTLPFAPGEAHTGTPHSASEGTETPEEGAHQTKADA